MVRRGTRQGGGEGDETTVSENQGVAATGRERWHQKGSQQSLYRFEDRLQSSIVAILRNPNNLSLVRTTDEQPAVGLENYWRRFYAAVISVARSPYLFFFHFFPSTTRNRSFATKILIT